MDALERKAPPDPSHIGSSHGLIRPQAPSIVFTRDTASMPSLARRMPPKKIKPMDRIKLARR